MRDGSARITIKWLTALFYRVDRKVAHAFASKDPNLFELRGACTRCGACCESPMITVPRLIFFARSLRTLFLAWQRWVNGMEFAREDRKTRTFVFTCTHYDPETRLCDSYKSRPVMCREYPRLLLEAPNPEFLDGCGYHAVYAQSDAMREALRKETNLPPDKLAELERKLRLDTPSESGESQSP